MSGGGMNEAFARVRAALGPDSGLVLVGGAVRDRLLERPSPDWDLASALLPEEVTVRARVAGLRVIPTGVQHGTVTVMVGAQGFEVTTFRGDEVYTDGRHPSSLRLGVALREDLARRDFTINAMALPAARVEDPAWRDHLEDPFGGREDLARATLRAVGDPLARFREDGLRALRACRFAAQLGFGIDPATLDAVPRALDVAAKVSVERVMTELTKLLCGRDPVRGLEPLAATGLLGLWLPELAPMIGCAQNRHHRFPVWEHTLEVVRATPADPALRWAALLHDSGKPTCRTVDPDGAIHFHGHEGASVAVVGAVLARLRASNALAHEVEALVRHHGTHPGPEWGAPACRRFLRRLQEDGLPLERWAAFRLADQTGKGWGPATFLADHQALISRLDGLAQSRPPLAVKALALDGKALMALANRKGGPWLGALQAHLLERVLDDPALNTPESLADLARTWLEAEGPAKP
jgi:tRNA nucleotidyltransferase (CCA-adding enzyme)